MANRFDASDGGRACVRSRSWRSENVVLQPTMQTNAATLAHLSDEQLIAEVEKRAAHERQATADLIASLVEMEGRLLYRGLGFSSMFAYCTQRLHRSEDATCNRLEVARAARQFPMLLDLVVEGSLTLTAARLLAPLL